mgnify:CR=1 FL=1|jgi:hypothetical protein
MTAEINAHTPPRDSVIGRAALDKRLEKLEIQVRCLRKQVLELEDRTRLRGPDTTSYGGSK